MLLQSTAHLGSAPPVPDLLHAELPLLPQSLACLDMPASVFGSMRAEFVFLLSVIDHVTLGSFSPARSLACSDSILSVLDPLHPGFPLPPRSPAWMELLLLVSGSAWPSSSPLALDLALSESSPFPRSSACLGFMSLACDLLHLGFLSLPHSFAYLGFFPPAWSAARLSFPLLACDLLLLGSFPSLQTLACADPSALPSGTEQREGTETKEGSPGHRQSTFGRTPAFLPVVSQRFPVN